LSLSKCWRVENARAFREPIPCKGKLNLYTLAPEFSDRARAALETSVSLERGPDELKWLGAMATQESPEQRLSDLYENYIVLDDLVNAFRLAERRVAQGKSADTLTDRARARDWGADVNATLADMNAALALEPESARSHFFRSRVYALLSRIDADRAAELDPAFAESDEGSAEEVEEEASE
jgi:hypothetical protein